MVVFNDRLFASSLYKPAGFFRFDGQNSWSPLPVPESMDATTRTLTERRVESLTVYEGHLYAGSYDGGHVYRFDGTTWEDCGQLGDNTQTYSFTQYDGALYVGTWPSGRAYRFQSPSQWIDCGRLGEELEVMGMMVHNGRLLAGTLPLAEVYEYRGATNWTQLTQLDHTPDVRYRRAWTMAEHDGRLFCSTLPSGHIYSVSAGQQVQWGHPLPPRWCEVIAVRSNDRLTLFVDRKQVAQSPPLKTTAWTLTTQAPLRIGAGMNGTLNGRLADLRIYRGAVTADSINTLPTAP
jgi:outer membrane protein assembly factor BamB